MPNHIQNEVIFKGLTEAQLEDILAAALDEDKQVDFSVLLPEPLYCWRYSVGQQHIQAFGEENTSLDWCRRHWGTKWNAYEQQPVETLTPRTGKADGFIIFRFQTAWSPPYGWLCALFNKLNLPFEYHWLDEGESWSHSGSFTPPAEDSEPYFDPWSEKKSTLETHRRIHKLMYGVEEFEDDADTEE